MYNMYSIHNMHGLVKGVYYCNQERTDELNERLYQRNIPSAELQPTFSLRPASTKYDHMGIFDKRPKSNVEIKRQPTFNVQSTFNPGNSIAPWSGYSTNINDESKLRNQYFALQRCEQSNWVPSSNSDLYKVVAVGRQEVQPFPHLFTEEKYTQFNPNTDNLGYELWNNHTRQQLKNNNKT
jgi:hypothetical protein